MTLENSTKPPGTTSGPVRTRRVSLPHNAKPYERKRPVNKKKKPNNEDEPEGLLSMLKTVITKPLGWIYRGTQQQPTTTSTTTTTTTKEQNSTGNVQGTINENGFSAPETEPQSNFHKEKSPTTTPRRKLSTQSLYAPKPAVAGSRKTLTLATSIQHPTPSPIQPKTDHELMIERVAAIPTPIRLKQANAPSAESTDSMECEESVPSVPINDFNARMSAFFQSKGNAPLTDEERQLILESVGQPSRFPPEAQGHLRPHQYMSSEIPNSSSYANQSPFVTRKRAFPVSPPSNALSYHMPYHQPSYPPSDFLRPIASSSRDYGRHVVESVPGSADRFGGSRMDVDRRYDLHERPGKRRDVRSNEERRRLQAMNEYAGNQDNFNAATAERIIQSLQRDNRTPLLDARRAPSSMYSRKGLIDPRTRRGQREMYPMEELPPSRPLATPILPPSRPTRTTGPYTKDRRAVKQRAAALAAVRKETDEDAAVSYFSSSASASAADPVAAPKATPKKKASATAAQMLAGIPMKGKGDDRLLKSISRTEDEDMDVDSGAGQKKNAAREIAISGEASRAFLTKPPSGLTDSVSTTEPLFNFTSKSQPTMSMTPTPLAAALKPKEVDADAMDEGDEDGKKQQGFSKRISLKARPAPRIPPKREVRGFSAEEDVEADEETIARENALKEIPALPINIAFAMKPSEPGVFKVPGLPASASNKPTENFAAAFTPFITTSTDSSVVPAPVTPATFAKLSPTKTTSPFATLTAATTTPAGPPPKSVYSGPAPQIDFANATTSNGTDISATVTAKPDTAQPVAPSTFGIVTPAVTSEPSTESAISTTPFGTPTKTSASLFGATSASAAPPALPVFSSPPTSTTTVVTTSEAAPPSVISTSKENAGPPAIFGLGKPATAAPVAPSMFGFGVPAVTSQPTTVSTTPFAPTEPKTSTSLFGATNASAAPPAFSFPATSSTTAVTTSAAAPALVIGTSKENAGPPAIFGFGKPADTSKPEVSAPTSTVVPSITPEVKATPTPAPVSFNFGANFGTPVKAASTPEESTEMQMSPAQTPTSGSNVGAPPPISFDPPPSSGAFIFGGTSQATAPVTATTSSSGFTGFAFTKPAATTNPASSGSGFTFGNTAAPSFNFGGGVTTPATGISFAGAAKTEEAAKPFAFGSGTPSTSTTTGAPSSGGFSFGANTTGFGTTSSTTATTPAAGTPFSFGQMTNGVNPSPAVGGNSGFTFGAPPTTGSAGFAFGGTSSSNAPTTFSFGGTSTPATPQQSSGPPSFQFGTGVPNGNNPTGGFSFQSQQQQPVYSGAAQQPFGFAFGGPQASTPAMAPASNPIQGGMTPFAFGAPSSAPTGGESLFSMGSITSGAKSGRAIARPRSKKR